MASPAFSQRRGAVDNTQAIGDAKLMSNVKIFDLNTQGTDYVCGDIHGMFDLLQDALLAQGFDESVDRLFALGDLIDRGGQSTTSIEYLQKDWFHSVLGNHEQMAVIAMKTRDRHVWGNWIVNGGEWIIDVDEEQWPKYCELYSNLPLLIELPLPDGQVVGLVHAEMPVLDWQQLKALVDCWPEQVQYDPDAIGLAEPLDLHKMLWGRERYVKGEPVNVVGIDHVFHGHTIVKKVKTLGNISYIDTGSHLSKQVTVLSPGDFLSQLPE